MQEQIEFVLLFLLGLMVHFPTSEIVFKTTKVSDWVLWWLPQDSSILFYFPSKNSTVENH